MSNITFIFFTFNEEKRLPYVVRNFSKFGRICLMDGGSTDGTREIAEQMGVDFFMRPKSMKANVETEENFEFIKSFLKTDWIYWGYVDNIAPRKLVEKFMDISMQNKIKQVMIPLYTYLWGNVDKYAFKSLAPFFFHKDFVDFKDNHIHGIGKFTGDKEQILILPNVDEYALKHFSTYNQEKFVLGHMRYANQEAVEKFMEKQKFSLFKLLKAMGYYFWIFAKYNYRNGKLGLIIILNYMFYRLMTYTRLYELENDITLENIEKKYSIKKEEMLKEFE